MPNRRLLIKNKPIYLTKMPQNLYNYLFGSSEANTNTNTDQNNLQVVGPIRNSSNTELVGQNSNNNDLQNPIDFPSAIEPSGRREDFSEQFPHYTGEEGIALINYICPLGGAIKFFSNYFIKTNIDSDENESLENENGLLNPNSDKANVSSVLKNTCALHESLGHIKNVPVPQIFTKPLGEFAGEITLNQFVSRGVHVLEFFNKYMRVHANILVAGVCGFGISKGIVKLYTKINKYNV